MSQLRNLTRGVQPEHIHLENGTHLLGRDEGCGLRVVHDSISTAHCEIEVAGSVVRVRDLGSTNGTFLDGAPIRSAELQAGQVLRTGQVEWKFESTTLRFGTATEPAPENKRASSPTVTLQTPRLNLNRPDAAEVAAAALPPVDRPCSKHPQISSTYVCENCRTEYCFDCTLKRNIEGRVKHYCPTCNNKCVPLADHETRQQLETARVERRRNLLNCPGDIFRYPFHRDGLVLLLGGTVMLWVMEIGLALAAHAGPFGLPALLLIPLFVFAYLLAYFRKIVEASADGEDALPDWPSFSSWWDEIGSPLLQFIGVMLLTLAPRMVARLVIGEAASGLWIRTLFDVWEAIYLPMAYLAVVMADNVVAANPVTVLLSIRRVRPAYFIGCLMYWGIKLLGMAMVMLPFGEYAPDSVLLEAAVIGSLTPVVIYLLAIEARILGLIYFGNSDRLGWFPEKTTP